MQQSIRELFQQVRWADGLDIAIVSILLYVVIIWLRERASRSLGIAGAGLIVLFALARGLDLYLTTLAFQYGSVAILLVFVVIFQNDIRHGFERLAASRWFLRSSARAPSEQLTDTLAEAVTHMARERIGALIVFPNREPLARHLRGGVDVDAKISLPVLLSVFHPQSPGHDGAVLIEHQRIAKLGLHLPLTKQIEKVHGGGTRHAAALGLAECSDAMALAVSEERGTITMAESGELQIIEPAQLADRLRTHFDMEHLADDQRRPLQDGLTLIASFTLASLLWFLFAYQADTIQRTFVIPIEYRNVPKGWEIRDPKPTFVEVTLSGSEPAFAVLDPASATVSLEVTEAADGGRTLRWDTEENLSNIPSELSVVQIDPPEVIVSLHRNSE